LAAGKELWRLAKTGYLFAFTPDSRQILANTSEGATMELRDAASGKLVANDRLPPRLPPWGAHGGLPEFALRFTPDGSGLLFHDRDKGMVVWDWKAGKERLRLPAGFVSNPHSAFSPDGNSHFTLGSKAQRFDLLQSRPLPRSEHGAAGPGIL